MRGSNLLFAFSLLLLSFSSCDKHAEPDPWGTAHLNREPLWESEILLITEPGTINRAGHSTDLNPIYNNTLMTGYADTTGKFFIGLDIHTGKRVWSSDYKTDMSFSAKVGLSFQDGAHFYFYGREITQRKADGSPISSEVAFYGFDITTGELLLKHVFPEFFWANPTIVRHLDGVIVSLDANWIDPDTGFEENQFFIHSTQNVTDRKLLKVKRSNNHQGNEVDGAGIGDFVLTKDDAGDIYLVYILSEAETWKSGKKHTPDNYDANLNCYNITQEKWVYQNKPCNAYYPSIVAHKDVIYCGNNGYPNEPKPLGLYAYNWKTGEAVWEQKPSAFDPNPNLIFDAHSLAYHNQTVIFGSVSFMYGVDANTGAVKWKKEGIIGNSGSPFVFHNGVAYATSGDGLLHGWDLETGELLLNAKCPSEGKTHNGRRIPGFFADIGLHVEPNGKGILIARNYLYAYAFETVR